MKTLETRKPGACAPGFLSSHVAVAASACSLTVGPLTAGPDYSRYPIDRSFSLSASSTFSGMGAFSEGAG